jgi:hypothetical protein
MISVGEREGERERGIVVLRKGWGGNAYKYG